MRALARIVGVVGVAVTLAACGALQDVMTLYTALDAHYHVPMHVNVNNGSHLEISLINPPQLSGSDADREAYARDVAAFAKAHYPHPDALSDVVVSYTTVEKKGPVTYTNTVASYHWTMAEVPAVPSDSAAATAVSRH